MTFRVRNHFRKVDQMAAILESIVRLISGSNKGQRRIWIEGIALLTGGAVHGRQYTKEVTADAIILSVTSGKGRHRIAGDSARPILDLSGKWVTKFMGSASHFEATITPGNITIRRS